MAGEAEIPRVPGGNGVDELTQSNNRSYFDITVVCTGNQFRSPLVEGLLRLSASELPVRVTSMGTKEFGPAKALPEAVELASEFGVDLSGHRARSLEKANLADADLVIGFELSHVAAAVVEARAPIERTFTIVELAQTLNDIDDPGITDPVARAREMVHRAHVLRIDRKNADATLQVADPVGGSVDVYAATAERLRALTRRLIECLFGRHFLVVN